MRRFLLLLVFLTVPATALAQGDLTADDVKKVMAENTREVRHCYEQHAMKQEQATGKVVLEMTVLANGRIDLTTVVINAEGVKGDRFARCVQRKMGKWSFPETASGADVSYPFLFQHTRG
jgi:hypothetical protein